MQVGTLRFFAVAPHLVQKFDQWRHQKDLFDVVIGNCLPYPGAVRKLSSGRTTTVAPAQAAHM